MDVLDYKAFTYDLTIQESWFSIRTNLLREGIAYYLGIP